MSLPTDKIKSSRSSKANLSNAQDNQQGFKSDGASSCQLRQSSEKALENRNDSFVNGGDVYTSHPHTLLEDSSNPSADIKMAEKNGAESKGSTPNPSASSSSACLERSLSSKSDLIETRDSTKKAKKKSWYNAFYPNYKSMSEDFKKIFPSIPLDERLIAGYSCAIQKDILVHGRLYLTKKYLCFYAKILNWETQLELAWKDVVTISREKTAYVIPNAISVCTSSEKHFFASFASRERTFLILDKIWHSALSEQGVSSSEIWQLVHSEYGEELGLTSEDEVDYVCPWNIEDQSSVCSKLMNEDSLAQSTLALNAKVSDTSDLSNDLNGGVSSKHPEVDSVEDHLCYESSDSSAELLPPASSAPKEHSETRRKKKRPLPPPPLVTPEENLDDWVAKHAGREMVDETIQMSVDTLFTYCFTDSKFFLDFHTSRKTSDIVLSPWSLKKDSEDKERVISFTISVTHPMGPKTSQVTETQVMNSESRPGYYYMIDVDTVNSGIPYADSFYVSSSFCLSRVSDNESRLTIKSSINFKKTVWGMLKSFIDKNAWTGLEEFYGSLLRTLHSECEVKRSTSSSGRKKASAQSGKSSHNNTTPRSPSAGKSPEQSESRDRKKMRSGRASHLDVNSGPVNESSTGPTAFFPLQLIIVLLVALFLTNVLLFVKIWNFESRLSTSGNPRESSGTHPYSLNGYTSYYLFQEDLLKLSSLPPPQTKEEWIQLLQKQELIHQMELGKWIELLEQVMTILRTTEKSLSDLEKNLHPWTLKKFRPSLFDEDLPVAKKTMEDTKKKEEL